MEVLVVLEDQTVVVTIGIRTKKTTTLIFKIKIMKKSILIFFGFTMSGFAYSQTTSTDPTTYKECSGIYYKGCKDRAGEDYIIQIQDCLGVEITGLFDKSTEDAIYQKISKRTFKKEDVKAICTFQAPNIIGL